MRGILVFDGRCGVCTRAVNALARWDRTGMLSIEPMQAPGMAERLGVTDDRMLKSAWWVDSSGAIYDGAHAMNAALAAALGTRIPLQLYRIPGVGAVQDAVYRWISTHRYRFPGAVPLCEAQPGRCA